MSHDEKYYESGISRKEINGKINYYYIKNNEPISKKDEERINKLRIPPSWDDLWISSDPNASIQAIGYDNKGRRQYRYHQIHIEKAEIEKFTRLQKFIKKIPTLQKILNKHSKLPLYDKNKVLSLMFELIMEHNMRVGKEQYVKENKSYGISSIRKKHVHIGNNIIVLRFKGKSNQRLQYTITNPSHISDIKQLMKLNNDRDEKVFQYILNGKIYGVTDKDLNDYLKEYMGDEFVVKDFRTYGANYYFIKSLLNETNKYLPRNLKIAKKNIRSAITSARYHLKHTQSISKKAYIMAFAVELYLNNPEFFIERKKNDTIDILEEILELYKETII